MKYSNVIMGVLVLFALFNVVLANSNEKNFSGTLFCLYKTVKNALAVGMLLLVVLAAIVYAVGQVMGAETRARASVWATAMFTGAIIGALLYILLPFILSKLFEGDSSNLDECIRNPSSANCPDTTTVNCP